MRCQNCGTEADRSYRFCPRCGHKYDPTAVRPQQRYMPSQPHRDDSKIAFIIIAIVVVFVVVSIVLSAILYFMVIGFGGSSTTTPAAAYSKLSVEGGVRISILSITKSDVWWDDVRVQVDEGIHFAEWETRGVDLDGGNPVTASYATEIN